MARIGCPCRPARCAAVRCDAVRCAGLLPVALDRVRAADVRLVGIRARVAQRPALAQQIPAAVELDLHLVQALAVCLQAVGVSAVLLLPVTQLVLLGHEPLDPRRDALVAHDKILPVSKSDALVDEVANELATWPGVHVERRADGAAVVRYEQVELGVLDPEHGVAELPELGDEREELLEHGEALADPYGVSHDIHGPSDVTAVLDLFDRRYRDVRGEDDPYSVEDRD
jgi:hypothetical protein